MPSDKEICQNNPDDDKGQMTDRSASEAIPIVDTGSDMLQCLPVKDLDFTAPKLSALEESEKAKKTSDGIRLRYHDKKRNI